MTERQELEVIEHVAPATLFGSDEPIAIIAKASAVATALKDVIQKQGLIANIKGKQHVLVDGWTLCGTMLGVFPVVVRTTELYRDDERIGFEAYTEARTISGAVVGAAVARCTKVEDRWRKADDYAILSMAQTRSVSKAMRVPLGFIISMAGYETTPAEEMHFLQEKDASAPTTAPDDEGKAEAPSGDFAERAEKIALRKRIRSEQPNHKAVVEGDLNYMELPELKEIAGPVQGAMV